MAYHNIRSKVERALANWIVQQQSIATASNVFPAKNSADKPLPVVVVHCTRAVMDPPYSGVFRCDVDVIVTSDGSIDSTQSTQDSRLASDALVAAVFDLFHADLNSAGDVLGENITTEARAIAASDEENSGDLANLTVLDVRSVSEDGDFIADGAAWQDTLSLEVIAVPSNVS